MQGWYTAKRRRVPIRLLQRVPLAILSLPSINYKGSGHAIIWRAGRMWDPSPKKRYNFGRLCRAPYVNVVALCRTRDEQALLKAMLYSDIEAVGGREIVLTYMVDVLNQTSPEETGALFTALTREMLRIKAGKIADEASFFIEPDDQPQDHEIEWGLAVETVDDSQQSWYRAGL
jgi:hypothetical protein